MKDLCTKTAIIQQGWLKPLFKLSGNRKAHRSIVIKQMRRGYKVMARQMRQAHESNQKEQWQGFHVYDLSKSQYGCRLLSNKANMIQLIKKQDNRSEGNSSAEAECESYSINCTSTKIIIAVLQILLYQCILFNYNHLNVRETY